MNNNFPGIWYASYGSNLLEERFRCYISGGTPRGAHRTYPGCTDKTSPKANKQVSINAELYFAKISRTWSGGGAGFIKPELDENVTTLGRMYLISVDQFIELVKQEIKCEGELEVDLEKAVREGMLDLRKEVWYSKLLYLGTEEGIPVLTFTNNNFLESEKNPPNEHYLKIIIEGLKETYDLSPAEIIEYLHSKPGIKNEEVEKNLPELINRPW